MTSLLHPQDKVFPKNAREGIKGSKIPAMLYDNHMDSQEPQNPQIAIEAATKDEPLRKKTKKGIIIASVTGGVLVSLLTATLITGGILLSKPSVSYSGIWYKSTAGFYDEQGNALADAGAFSFEKVENSGSPYFELTGISLNKSGIKNIVLPVRSEDDQGKTYYVRSVSSFPSGNLFGSTDNDDSIIGIYGESFYQTIGDYAFANLKKLQTLEFGSPTASDDSVQNVGAFAFSNNPALQKLHFSNALKNVGEGVCANDVALEKADFSSTLLVGFGLQSLTTASVYSGAFQNCAKLSSFVFPGTLQTLGDHAFQGCALLTDVGFNGSKEFFAKAAFNSKDYHDPTLKTITCTDGVIAL